MFKKAMIKIMDQRNKKIAKVDGDNIPKKEIKEAAMATSSKEFLACLFILLADNGQYKGLRIELANNFTMGKSNEPKTLVAAKRILTDYIAPGKSTYVKQEPDSVGVAFSKTDCDNDWKRTSVVTDAALRGISSRNVTRPFRRKKEKIYAMKKAVTSKAKKTGVVNAIVKGTSGDDTSAALSVTIIG